MTFYILEQLKKETLNLKESKGCMRRVEYGKWKGENDLFMLWNIALTT